MEWRRPHVSGSLLAQADGDQQSISGHMKPLVLEDGSSLEVFDVGRGDPVLLLPMIDLLNFVYAPQIEEFQSEYRTILYVPRLSDRRRVGIPDRVNEALSLMQRLGIESAHIVVWGDTGSAAYYLAKHHPERVRSIVFIGLADRYKFPQPYQFLMQLLARLPIESLVPSWLFAAILSRVVGGTQVKPRWIAMRAAKVPRLTRLFKLSILPNLTDHKPMPGEVHAPCLVISGDNDRIVSAAQARRMSRLLPNVRRTAIIPGGEHFISYIDSATVNGLIRQFFTEVSATTT
ncbi:MAG: alpha/beta hydrolase [Chloroflexota bacterium]|nr:alpha/beta hydrolase [Chloroflexota bacterium]